MLGKGKISKEEFADKWENAREKFYRLAYCYVKNEGDAREILSEATYQAYLAKDKLREPELFDTWMSRIIIHEAYHFIKKSKKTLPLQDELLEQETDDAIQEAEDGIDVYQLLEKVTKEEKTLLILKYFEEKSFREISRIVGLSENTVKTKIYRALSRMGREYEGG